MAIISRSWSDAKAEEFEGRLAAEAYKKTCSVTKMQLDATTSMASRQYEQVSTPKDEDRYKKV